MKRLLVLVFSVWVVAGTCPTDLEEWNAFKVIIKLLHLLTNDSISVQQFCFYFQHFH